MANIHTGLINNIASDVTVCSCFRIGICLVVTKYSNKFDYIGTFGDASQLLPY